MKKIFVILMLSAVLAGCAKDFSQTPLPSSPSQEDVLSGVLSMSSEMTLASEVIIKSGSNQSLEMPLRYVVEAWTRGAEPKCVMHTEGKGTGAAAEIEIMLPKGVYDFIFWADAGETSYDVSDLRNVKPGYGSGLSREAFAKVMEAQAWDGKGFAVILKRTLAKLTVLNKYPFRTAMPVQITYTNLPDTYDVLTGKAVSSGNPSSEVTVPFPDVTVGNREVAEDFILVPTENGVSVGVKIKVGEVTKEVEDLRIEVNYKTELTATFENNGN